MKTYEYLCHRIYYRVVQKPRPLATVSQKVPNISAGSVVTCFRCGGILNDHLLVVTNLRLRLAVKELWKWVGICGSEM